MHGIMQQRLGRETEKLPGRYSDVRFHSCLHYQQGLYLKVIYERIFQVINPFAVLT